MFDQMFEDFKSQFEDWAKSGVEQLGKEINNRWGIPEPDGEFELFRSFDIIESLISQGCISIEDGSWRIEAYDSVPQADLLNASTSDQAVRKTQLFEFDEPSDTEACIICCRAWAKTSGMTKVAKLRLGFERETEFFGMSGGSINKSYGVSMSNSKWQEYEVRHHFTKKQYPTKFWLNLNFYQPGVIWLKDIRLFKAPFKQN